MKERPIRKSAHHQIELRSQNILIVRRIDDGDRQAVHAKGREILHMRSLDCILTCRKI